MWINSEEFRKIILERSGKLSYTSGELLEVLGLMEDRAVSVGDTLYSVDLKEPGEVQVHMVESILDDGEEILLREADEEVICTLEEFQKGITHLGFRRVFGVQEEAETFLRDMEGVSRTKNYDFLK